MRSVTLNNKVLENLGQIEEQLRALKWWSDKEPPAEIFVNMGPFGMNTMPFCSWLEYVLIPRVKEMISSGEDFPPDSQVSDQAFREYYMWGGYEEEKDERVDRLYETLKEFDELMNRNHV